MKARISMGKCPHMATDGPYPEILKQKMAQRLFLSLQGHEEDHKMALYPLAKSARRLQRVAISKPPMIFGSE